MLTVDEKNLSITDGTNVLYYLNPTVEALVNGADIDDCLDNVKNLIEDYYEEYEDGYEELDECPDELKKILMEVDQILNGESENYTDAEKIDLMKLIVKMCNEKNVTNIFGTATDRKGNMIHKAIKVWLNTKHGVDLFDNQYI